MAGDTQSYATKQAEYFSGERRDIIDRLDAKKRAIVEIGCGDGATGAYAKRSGKCDYYVGIELFPAAAKVAADRIDDVFVANVEQFELPDDVGDFDVLIASEVLEHLVDPWSVLRRFHKRLRPGAEVFASSPNVAHHSVISMLLRGKWSLEDQGRMDRTHLRWFTPSSYAEMFRDCGYDVISVRPLVEPTIKKRVFDYLTFGAWRHLLMSQIVLHAKKRP